MYTSAFRENEMCKHSFVLLEKHDERPCGKKCHLSPRVCFSDDTNESFHISLVLYEAGKY